MPSRGCNSGQLSTLHVLRNELQDGLSIYLTLLAKDRHLLRNVLQLADIAGPLVFQQQLLGLIRQRDFRQTILLCHLHGKKSKQQHDVFTTVTQRRDGDGNRIQAIEQVFSETAFSDGLAHIHIGGRNNAHIRLHDLLSSHADILTRFQYSQQAGLRSQGQLSHLV